MTSTQVLLGWLAAALLCCGETPATAPRTGPQDVQPSEIELAIAALGQPGADHRQDRENAVQTLLAKTEQTAHIVLQDRLREGDDPEKLSLYILEELERSVSNPANAVFGVGAGEAGTLLLKSYIPALVSAFIEEGADVVKHRVLRPKALECLRHMPARPRLEGLQALLAPGVQDVEMQRAALRAAASCRETGLAVLLGAHLDGSLGEVARAGLEQLTFQDFGTGPGARRDFQAWWADNSGTTYLELVESVAQSAAAVQRAQQQKLIDTQVALMEALVGQQTVKWQDIHQLVLADEPKGSLRACLTRLQGILQSKVHDGNAAEARIAFHNALLGRQAEAEIEQRALLLEIAAYLIRPVEGRERQAMEALLVQDLASPHPSLRRAALRGLQRFPSPANRAAVVQVANDSLAGAGVDDLLTLEMALRSLQGPGWSAPRPDEPDYPGWIRVLRQLFARDNSPQLLEEGIDVAFLSDADGGHPTEVFALLLGVATSSQIEINQRVRVILNIEQFVTSENARTHLMEMVKLLDDESSEIRRQAAGRLANPPEPRGIEREEREEWLLEVRRKVAERMLEEPREDVFQALVTCLMGLSDQQPEIVISIFKTSLETLPEEQERHREIVITKLTELGLSDELEVAQWQIAADVLLENERRDAALNILTKQAASELTGQAPQEQQRGLELLVRAALQKPAGERSSTAEAEMVLTAFARLESEFGSPRNDASHQLLRLQLHDVLGDDGGGHNGEIIRLGSIFLGENTILSAGERDQVLILMARANLREGEAEDARQTLERISPPGKTTNAAIAVYHEVGKSLMAQESTAARAVEVLTTVVDNTNPESVTYRERFLDLAEATLTSDPGKRTEVVQMLQAKAPLFNADDCPPSERERFRKLLEPTDG